LETTPLSVPGTIFGVWSRTSLGHLEAFTESIQLSNHTKAIDQTIINIVHTLSQAKTSTHNRHVSSTSGRGTRFQDQWYLVKPALGSMLAHRCTKPTFGTAPREFALTSKRTDPMRIYNYVSGSRLAVSALCRALPAACVASV